MEPISAAVSIIGLLAAGSKICSEINGLVENAREPPKLANEIVTEISMITACLNQIQSFTVTLNDVPQSRQSLVKVGDIVIILTNCVMVYSELEKELQTLNPGLKGAIRALRWNSKEKIIHGLLRRLQSCKTSLNLMLSTFTCKSLNEAQSFADQMRPVLSNLISSNQDLSSRLARLEDQHSTRVSRFDSSLHTELRRESITRRPVHEDRKSILKSFGFSFEGELNQSRPYMRTFRRLEDSADSSIVLTRGWSYFSGLSLAEVSNLSVIKLAMSRSDIINYYYYANVHQESQTQQRQSWLSAIDLEHRSDNNASTGWLENSSFVRLPPLRSGKSRNAGLVSNAGGRILNHSGKIYLLGISQSGKSTMFNQILNLYDEGFERYWDLDDRSSVINKLVEFFAQANIFQTEQSDSPKIKDRQQYFDGIRLSELDKWTPQQSRNALHMLKNFWDIPGVQSSSTDNIAFYMKHIDSIVNNKPSDELMQFLYRKTVGIYRRKINFLGASLHMVDFACDKQKGSLLKRVCKVDDKFMFLVSLTGYFQGGNRSSTVAGLALCALGVQSQMQISLDVFRLLTGMFPKQSIIILFTKQDLFEINLVKHPVSRYFSDCDDRYGSGVDSIESAMEFFKDNFYRADRRDSQTKSKYPLTFFPINLTDYDSVESLMTVLGPFVRGESRLSE